jgi:hypothetical protein
MIRRYTQHRSRSAPLAARLVIVAIAGALVVSCGDDDNGGGRTPTAAPATNTATRTVTPTVAATRTATPPNDNAGAACTKLASCNQCMTSFFGSCLSTDDCAARLSADAAICINAAIGCDATALGDCLFLGCDGSDATGECQ